MKKFYSFILLGVLAVFGAAAQTGSDQLITQRPEGRAYDNLSRSTMSYFTYLNAMLPMPTYGLQSEIVINQEKGEFYLYNPLSRLNTETYLKGTIDAQGNVTIPTPQYIFRKVDGNVVEDYYIFRMKNEGDQKLPKFVADRANSELKFTWKDGVLTQTDGGVLALGYIDGECAGYADEDIKMVSVTETPVAPADPSKLDLKEYILGFTNHHDVADVVMAKMAYDGNDVWLTDFIPDMENVWLKGTTDGNSVTFTSGQLLGVCDGYYAYFYGARRDIGENMQGTPETIYILEPDLMFTPSSKGLLATDVVFEVNAGNGESSYLYAYSNPEIILFEDKPQVPARPLLGQFTPAGGQFPIGMLGITINPFNQKKGTQDVDFIDPSLLYYTIYINDMKNPLVIKAKDFPGWIKEDTSLIPCKFNDGTNDGSIAMIYNYNNTTFIFNNVSWQEFGVQTIYFGGGEERRSATVWTNGDIIPSEWDNGEVGVEGVGVDANDEIVAYYDLMGRQVVNPEKGIYIVRTASGKTFKVVK